MWAMYRSKSTLVNTFGDKVEPSAVGRFYQI